MSESYTIGDYLIDRLKEVGVEHVFGVPGDFGFPFMDQIEDTPGITWIGACNELNAAYAADGYARSRGIAAITGSCGVLENRQSQHGQGLDGAIVHREHVRALMQTSWDAIGWTTPAMAGSQLADPHSRHLHVVGDGGFQETAQEVSMLLRYGVAPITILVNNGTYQVENVIHQDSPVDKVYNRLHGWSYSQLPAALGGENALGVRVQTEDELAAAVAAAAVAHREGRYTLIEVVVARDDIATTFAEFTGGQHR